MADEKRAMADATPVVHASTTDPSKLVLCGDGREYLDRSTWIREAVTCPDCIRLRTASAPTCAHDEILSISYEHVETGGRSGIARWCLDCGALSRNEDQPYPSTGRTWRVPRRASASPDDREAIVQAFELIESAAVEGIGPAETWRRISKASDVLEAAMDRKFAPVSSNVPTPDAVHSFACVNPKSAEGQLRSVLWEILGGMGSESVENAAQRVVRDRDVARAERDANAQKSREGWIEVARRNDTIAELRSGSAQALDEERERCARHCEVLAYMLEHGAGDPPPGTRLRQAAQNIRSGKPATLWLDIKGVDPEASPCARPTQTSEGVGALSGERASHEPDLSPRAEAPKSPGPTPPATSDAQSYCAHCNRPMSACDVAGDECPERERRSGDASCICERQATEFFAPDCPVHDVERRERDQPCQQTRSQGPSSSLSSSGSSSPDASSPSDEAGPNASAVVWANEATPFDGPQAKALLDENERLRTALAATAAHLGIGFEPATDDAEMLYMVPEQTDNVLQALRRAATGVSPSSSADLDLLSRFIVDHAKDLVGRSDGACKQCYPDNTWPGSFVCAQHRAREIQAALFTSPAKEKP